MHVYVIGDPNPLYPEPLGAIEQYTYGLSKELSKKVTVSISGFGSGREFSNNFSLTTYSSKGFEAFKHFPDERLRGMICGAIHSLFAFKDILRVNKKNKIDIIHANTIYAAPMVGLCKIILGIPSVCSIHNELVTVFPLRVYDKVLPVSDYLRRFLNSKKDLSAQIIILPDAINNSEYRTKLNKTDAKRKLNLENRQIILFVGRKCPEKGPQVLIQALQYLKEKYPQSIGVFLGPDDYFGSTSTVYSEFLFLEAKKLGLEKNVQLRGYITKEDLQVYYIAADVFVCPSIWNEPFGIVLLEALNYQKPVVATRVGGIPEVIIDGQTGLLVQPNNPQELAACIISLLDNSELGQKLGKEGRKAVDTHFNFEAISDQCIIIYNQVLASNNRRHFY